MSMSTASTLNINTNNLISLVLYLGYAISMPCTAAMSQQLNHTDDLLDDFCDRHSSKALNESVWLKNLPEKNQAMHAQDSDFSVFTIYDKNHM